MGWKARSRQFDIQNARKIMAPILLVLGFLLISFSRAESTTAYEMLEMYGFPKGILPEGVTSYVLREDGSFEVHFGGRGDCDFAVEGGYVLDYKRKISGRFDQSAGSLKELRGVSVKILFVWFGISEVVKGQNSLSFYVGPFSASFPLSNFEDCPRCRCGATCAEISDS